MSKTINLLSNTTRVETPFITVKIGAYEFGKYTKNGNKSIYPNFVDSLSVTKVNGAVNTYSLRLVYAIQAGDDPNFLEKVFSSVSDTREIEFSYGDLSSPSYIYKSEKAIINSISTSVGINSSVLTYTISATSTALNLNAGNITFPAVKGKKPSSIIKELIKTEAFLSIFGGMRDYDLILRNKLIADDDIQVDLIQKYCSPLDYLKYLVSCMSPLDDKGNYLISIIDDYTGEYGGAYFKINKLVSEVSENSIDSLNMYEINIGYKDTNLVTSFSIDDTQTYALLTKYSDSVQQTKYSTEINDDGTISTVYSPTLTNSSSLYKTTAADKNWWNYVTQFPIKATLVLKGLLKPALLMSYINVNVYFYGLKHSSSGIYMITKQVDDISTSGYRSTLSLTRIKTSE